MRKLLSFVLLAAGTLFAGAYEYPFDWADMSANAYSNEQTVTSKPASGIDLYINTRGDVAPYIYAWLENGTELFGGWPGTKT
ncbi:MAG: hypothetical protein IKH19_00795 [Muribaculaceae bacterium]|nr:hypothetical protein [Muribaculaceae bacterium]